jgi:hypothetical protein
MDLLGHDLYKKYTDCIDTPDFDSFKINPSYSYMLEHDADPRQCFISEAHINVALNTVTIDDIKEFCAMNDSVGSPELCQFSHGITSSCGSLRYVGHSILILTHFSKFSNEIDIVEIGGGYGGLAAAMYFFAPKMNMKVNSYAIIDLPSPLKLQAKYLEKLGVTGVKFSDAYLYGNDLKDNLFLISNYAFSELSEGMRKSYEGILFPKVRHGYIIWNYIPVYNFGFEYEEISEKDVTGAPNELSSHVKF